MVPSSSSGDNEAPENVLVSYVILYRRRTWRDCRDGPTRWPRGCPIHHDRPPTNAPAIWRSCSLCCPGGSVVVGVLLRRVPPLRPHRRASTTKRRTTACTQSAGYSCTRCDAAPLSSDRPVPQQEAINAPGCCLLHLCCTKLTHSPARARANDCHPRRLHALPQRIVARPTPTRFRLGVRSGGRSAASHPLRLVCACCDSHLRARPAFPTTPRPATSSLRPA